MVLIKSPKHNYKKNGTTKKSIHCDTELKEKKQISKKKVILLIILIVLSITITIIMIIKYNQPHNKTNTIQNNELQNKELSPQEKYDKAMSLLKDDEKKAVELLREIPDFKDAKTYIDNYDFKHRFDGTYFMFIGDIDSAKEKSSIPSLRIVINGLSQNTNIIMYQYNKSNLYLDGTTYYKGRFNTRTIKLICDETLTTCKQIVLNTVDENGYHQETFDENADDIYYISSYVFSENLITEKTHYINNKYELDNDTILTYKKISDVVELPPERQETEYPQEPKIGMTKEEVRKSTWGYPEKINKDTYSWGVKEQWVYDNGYIYFKNGIVTSISER